MWQIIISCLLLLYKYIIYFHHSQLVISYVKIIEELIVVLEFFDILVKN